jgi:hypothetical protein
MKTLIYFFAILGLVSCGNGNDNVKAELEVLDNIAPDLKIEQALNISGWKFDKSSVKRVINLTAFERDSLCYFLKKEDWYTPISKSEGDIEYYIELKLSDIDTTNIYGAVGKDDMFFTIYMTNGKKIKISKINWNGPHVNRIWTIESDSISLDFPNNLQRIQKEFARYEMYDATSNSVTDYVEQPDENYHDTLFLREVVQILKESIK